MLTTPTLRALLGVSAAAIVVACGSGSKPSHSADAQTRSITGKINVVAPPDSDAVALRGVLNGKPCQGDTAADDSGGTYLGPTVKALVPGAQVVVKNEAGTTIGTGTVGNGKWTMSDDRRGLACVMSYSAHDVSPAKFYSVTLPGQADKQFSDAQIAQSGFSADITISVT